MSEVCSTCFGSIFHACSTLLIWIRLCNWAFFPGQVKAFLFSNKKNPAGMFRTGPTFPLTLTPTVYFLPKKKMIILFSYGCLLFSGKSSINHRRNTLFEHLISKLLPLMNYHYLLLLYWFSIICKSLLSQSWLRQSALTAKQVCDSDAQAVYNAILCRAM